MKNDRIDFIGIGAPKSGTTWIASCLAGHPEIGFAKEKEVYFFSDSVIRTQFKAGFDHFARGIAWYHRQFPSSTPATRVFGEYTVGYMYDPRSADRIRDYRSDIRLLVALRNPVEMVYSWYRYNRTGLISKLPDTFESTMALAVFRDLGCYYHALKPFYDRFSSSQIKVVLYDDIGNDPRGVLRELFSFLDVDSDFQPVQAENRVNPALATRLPFLQMAGQSAFGMMKNIPFLSSMASSRHFEKALLAVYGRLNRVPMNYPPIRPETRINLIEYYREDVERLETLLQRDLGAWYHEP
jgi:hypothetical protein